MEWMEVIVILYTVKREAFRDEMKLKMRPEYYKGAIDADSKGKEF